MFVFVENGLLRQDGSVNTELVYYLTNYGIDFTLVTEKPKTGLNAWDVSEAVKSAGLPQSAAINCLFDASVDKIMEIGQPKDVVFTDCERMVYCLGDVFRIIGTMSLAAYVV